MSDREPTPLEAVATLLIVVFSIEVCLMMSCFLPENYLSFLGLFITMVLTLFPTGYIIGKIFKSAECESHKAVKP